MEIIEIVQVCEICCLWLTPVKEHTDDSLEPIK